MIAFRMLTARSSSVWSHSPEPPTGISGDGEAFGAGKELPGVGSNEPSVGVGKAFGATAGACDEPSVGEAFGDGNEFPVGSEAGA